MNGKRFGRPAILFCIAVVRDISGHDQVMRRIPLFDQLEQFYGVFVVFLAAMEVKIADVDEFHTPLPLPRISPNIYCMKPNLARYPIKKLLRLLALVPLQLYFLTSGFIE